MVVHSAIPFYTFLALESTFLWEGSPGGSQLTQQPCGCSTLPCGCQECMCELGKQIWQLGADWGPQHPVPADVRNCRNSAGLTGHAQAVVLPVVGCAHSPMRACSFMLAAWPGQSYDLMF